MFDSVFKGTLAPLALRIGLAAVFIFHGQDKVFGDGNEFGADWDRGEHPLGLGTVEQLAVAWGELLGGIAVGLGALARVAALGLAVIMSGAIAKVTWDNGFDLRDGGFEFNLALIALSAGVFFWGAGNLSFDHMIWGKKKGG